MKKNIDFSEIINFSSISYNWWNMDGEFKLLHRINPLRLNYIFVRSKGLFGKKILDVGCGGGILSESMALEGADVTGLDIDKKSLLVAKLHAMENQLTIKYLNQTVEEHLQKNLYTYYDIVTCMEVLEHVHDPASIVRACSKLVKPGGDVFLSTLNRNIKSWILAIIGAEYFLRIIPKGTHNLNKFIKPSELLKWTDTTKLREKDIVGLHYYPIKDCFEFNNNIDIHYTLHLQHIK